ncbi:hypothetical protein C8Q77DRAFT_1074377 [Trametes polyzona]|nr:hypothetical protein C8Q77DRAFT_1074377 [Trametes polyzona]
MKVIKRFLRFKLPSPGPPKQQKAYCRYPGCGQPFKPQDRLDEFCSPRCLRDYNYVPPAPWYPPPDGGRQGWWRRRRNESGPPQHHRRCYSTTEPPFDPDRRVWGATTVKLHHLHSNSYNVAHDRVAGVSPTNRGPTGSVYTVPPPATYGYLIRQPPQAPVPTKRPRTRAHNLPRPPSTKFRHRPLPPVPPNVHAAHAVQSVDPNFTLAVEVNGMPTSTHVVPRQASHGRSSRGPEVGHPARSRSTVYAHRGPPLRPRSNTFGGYRFPPPPRRHH